VEKDAAEGKGDLAVATGNTLLKKADSLVKPAPPPAAPRPLRLDQEPEALEKVVPEYPAWAEEQGVTSRVLVMVTIDAEGKVVDARIGKSGGKDFDAAALKAARSTRYKPYVEGGKPLPAEFAVAYEFVL
jgi:protein TonB